MTSNHVPLVPGQLGAVQEEAVETRQFVVYASYEAFVFSLSILQLVNSVLWMWLRGTQGQQVVVAVSLGISLFLFLDAAYRLRRAYRRRDPVFRRFSWLWLLGSVPVPFIILFRFVAYGILSRKLRRRDYEAMGDVVVEKRAQSTLLAAIFAAVVVLELAALLIIGAEAKSSQANILDSNDAIWWTIVTMATVGYGDRYPVTTWGRVIGIFVMIIGVALFSVLTSFLAQWFVRKNQSTEELKEPAPTSEDYQALTARLDAISALLEQQASTQQLAADDLRARLAEIERALIK